MLNPGGPAVDRAISFSFIPADIDGIPRPTGMASDIGAREYSVLKALPGKNQGAGSTKWLFPGLAALLALTGILVFRKKRRKKGEKTGYLFREPPGRKDKPFKTFKS